MPCNVQEGYQHFMPLQSSGQIFFATLVSVYEVTSKCSYFNT